MIAKTLKKAAQAQQAIKSYYFLGFAELIEESIVEWACVDGAKVFADGSVLVKNRGHEYYMAGVELALFFDETGVI